MSSHYVLIDQASYNASLI